MQRHLIFSIALIFSGWLHIQAQISYVKVGGSGNGTSWADASGDLQAVLASSTFGTQIWVAKGTYLPIQCSSCTLSERDTPFAVPDGVELYGGFSGNETTLNQRNWIANPTILSGDINQDGILTNNSYTILYTKNVSAATIIDGFEVIEAYAENGNYDVYTRINSGGGLYNDGSVSGGSSHPVIRNCKFLNHYGRGFGAAIMNYGGFGGACSPEIFDCEFINNDVFSNGGAVYNSGVFSGQSSTAFVRCKFEDNDAQNGGAVYNQGSENGSISVTFDDCEFKNNTAVTWGGAIVEFGNNGSCLSSYNNCTFISNTASLGGAILNDASFGGICDPNYINCNWYNNSANLGGGGVYSEGPFGGQSNPSFMECTFDNNTTNQSGAALYFNGQEGNSNGKITNSTFTNNKAIMYGGGMYNFGKTGHANPIITNCLFIANEGAAAGSIYNYGGVNGESSPIVTNCTFTKNIANVGPCIYNQAADPTGTVAPMVSNCIFWDNISSSGFGLVFQNGYANPSINHCIVQVDDCAEFNTDVNSTVNCGSTLLFNVDPLFANQNVNDFHLLENSPAVDFGDNNTINATGITIDLDSTDRVTNGVVDFGVYEYESSSYQAPVVVSQASSSSHCAGDSKTLFVVTSGTPPLSYQWKKDGTPITGATDSINVFSSLNINDEGSYTCVVTSGQGDMVESNPTIVEVDPLLNVEIDIQSSVTTICQGEMVIFNASGTNGGNNPTYSWMVNNVPVGSNENQLQLNSLNDGDEITCAFTSSEACTIASSVTSNTVVIQVLPILQVGVSLTASATTICANESVTINAVAENPGTNPVYSWYLNSQQLPNTGASIDLGMLNDGDQISCELQSSETCTSNNPAVSSSIIITVEPVLEAQVSVTASTTEICEGETIVFEATGVNEGSSPEYNWFVNSIPVLTTGNQLSKDDFQDGDIVTCELTSSYSCLQQNPVTASPIAITVDEIVEAEISITSSSLEICEGEEITLDALATNGGANPEYLWFVNGIQTGNSANQLLLVNPMDGDLITCLLVSSRNCILTDTVSSNTLEVVVSESLEASILIETPQVSICDGQEVLITTDPQNMGSNPTYKWLLNGTDQGVNAPEFLTSSLVDGDILRCELTSSLECVTQNPVISNSLIFSVQPTLEATIEVAVNSNAIACLGDTLTFNATTSNAGMQPEYQWLLDGIGVGIDAPTLILDNLPLGASNVQCVLTSSEECVEQNPVSSNLMEITIVNDASCTVATTLLPGIKEAFIFPNPSENGQFAIDITGNHHGLELRVRDVQGRLWFSQNHIEVNQHRQIQVELPVHFKGLFYVELVSQNNLQVLKAIAF